MQQIAEETHAAVAALTEFIRREVPSRTEVEARFPNRSELSLKRRQAWFIIAGITVLALFFGFLATVTTVSACFVGGNPQPDGTVEHSPVCGIMPGYNESVAQQEELIKQFKKLVETTQRNELRIQRLERRLED